MIKRNGGYLTYRDEPASEASRQLEDEGYTLVRGVFTDAEVTALKADIDRVYETYEPDERSSVRPLEAAQMFRYEMLNRSDICQEAIAHRGILDVIEPLLGEDCHIIANTAWRNPPGSDSGHAGDRWHIDAGPHIPLPDGALWPRELPHPVFAIGVHIYLKACSLKDGPTGVIPFSHLSGRTPPPDQLLNSDLTYDGQGVVPLLTEPGDVGFFVSDVWHRRMPTQPGDGGRFFLQAHYGRRDIAQRLKTTSEINQLAAETVARAETARDKTVIGLHQPFFYDG